MQFFGRVLKFGNPGRADVVIFDETNAHIVRQVINPKYKILVLSVRPEVLWFGHRIILNFFSLLWQLNLSEASQYSNGFLRGIFLQHHSQ